LVVPRARRHARRRHRAESGRAPRRRRPWRRSSTSAGRPRPRANPSVGAALPTRPPARGRGPGRRSARQRPAPDGAAARTGGGGWRAAPGDRFSSALRAPERGAPWRTAMPLQMRRQSAYIVARRRWSTMAINAARNRRSGPGGSSRRLHQNPFGAQYGGDSGSTRVIKGLVFARHGTAVIGPSLQVPTTTVWLSLPSH